jgi:RimJ/RimL family protein N-acetyltransferase
VEVSDCDHYRRWFSDPDIRRYLRMFQPISEKTEREYIESTGSRPDTITLAIALKDGDEHIGGTGLHEIRWKDRAGSFGIFIGPAAQREKGYGTEVTRLIVRYAFESLNFNRLELLVYANNPRAIKVYEKVGFVHEGTRRENVFIDGAYVDELIYSMLAREYFAQR